jgi:hypothetical protein
MTDRPDLHPAWVEFVNTEETYQETLLIMSSLCKAVVAFKLANCEVTNSIFLNSEELLECNREMLRLILVRGPGDMRQLAYAFSACRAQMESVYKSYLQQFKTAQDILELYLKEGKFMALVSPFMSTLDQMRRTREDPMSPPVSPRNEATKRNADNMKMRGLLVSPVQRICKYELMIGQMLKQAATDDTELCMQMQEAYNVSKNLCSMINDKMEPGLDTSAKRIMKRLERTVSKRGSVITADIIP